LAGMLCGMSVFLISLITRMMSVCLMSGYAGNRANQYMEAGHETI